MKTVGKRGGGVKKAQVHAESHDVKKGVLKTVKTCKNFLKTFARIESDCILKICNWSQFVNKKTFHKRGSQTCLCISSTL